MILRPLAALAAATFVLPLAAQDLVAVKAGKIVTVSGPTIEDGVVLIQNGRISKIGKQAEVEIPWEAKVVDATGKTVLPTWVLAHSTGGARGNNESMQNVPFVSIADALDPASTWFEECLRNGVGTVHALPGDQTLLGGIGLVVRPCGRTVEDMAVATQSGIKLSLQPQGGGRLMQIRKLRRALEEAKEYRTDYERRKKEFEQEQKAGAIPADKKWTEEIDRTKKPILDLIDKKLKGWLYVPSSAEVPEAVRLSKELDLVLVLGQKVDQGIDELKTLGAPVVLDSTLEFHDTDRETLKERLVSIPKLMADAGIPFALSIGNGAEGYPWWQLATCVRSGVDRRTAIEALTIVPARLLGLADQVGSLAEGKLGNLQVLSGDPLQATTWVETVVLEGQVVYERDKDARLRYLFEQPAGETKAASGEGK